MRKSLQLISPDKSAHEKRTGDNLRILSLFSVLATLSGVFGILCK
jgi:hypothetical protein